MAGKIKEYESDELTVVWEAEKCIHSEKCFKGLSNVFDPNARPWINVNGADDQTIKKQIDACPSGALSYKLHNEAAQSSEIQVLADGKIRALFPNKVKGVSLGDQIFAPYDYVSEGNVQAKVFFEVLEEGKISLLRRYSTTHEKADFHPVLGAVGNDLKVVVQKDLYYKRAGQPAQKLKKGKKSVLSLFERKANNVQQFAREQRLGYNKVEDLKMLFHYYNN